VIFKLQTVLQISFNVIYLSGAYAAIKAPQWHLKQLAMGKWPGRSHKVVGNGAIR